MLLRGATFPQVSLAGTTSALTGDERHGRTLRFRAEEILDSIAINYAFDYADYATYYSVENLYIQDAETTRHLLYDRIPRSTIACYLLSEDYMALKGTILEVFNTMGSKSIEQLRRDYLVPAFRQLDIEVTRNSYAEYKEALLQIFLEASHYQLVESYGRWHYPAQAEWKQTMTPPVNPDYVFGHRRSRI